jgi:hemerythrin-like domain-containing protein
VENRYGKPVAGLGVGWPSFAGVMSPRLGLDVTVHHDRYDETALKDLIALLRTLADQCHHGKEEGYLYPSMKEKGIPPDGPIARLLAEHSEVRDYLGTLSGLPSRAERAAAALLYVRVMRQHIEQENAVIFPVADRLFTPEEQAALARAVRRWSRTFGARFGRRRGRARPDRAGHPGLTGAGPTAWPEACRSLQSRPGSGRDRPAPGA